MSLAARPGRFGTRFHNRLYELLGLDYVYKAFTTTDLPAAIGGVRALGIRGCAISMPFKEAVIPLLDGLDSSAAAIDSVNTIVNDDGRLTGHNTDYTAIVSLLAQAGIRPDTPFLLHGAGGMAKAVAAALRDRGHRHGTIVARNAARGRPLADSYGYRWTPDFDGETASLLINATPLGMAGSAMAFDVGNGDPAYQTAVQQQATRAELVVVGKRRASALARFLTGSVAQRLAKWAESDVLVVPIDGLAEPVPMMASQG